MAMARQERQEGLQRPGTATRCAREEHPAPCRSAPKARSTANPNVDAIPVETEAAAAPKAADGPKPTGVDKELEERTKKAEADEKAKQAAEAAKIAKAKADNCALARQGKATVDSGVRIARVNAQGEREIMDDAARAAEQKRLQTVINSDCK